MRDNALRISMRMLLGCSLGLTGLGTLAVAGSASGQAAETTPSGADLGGERGAERARAGLALPDSPVGRQVAWFMGALSGDDPGDVGSHFTPEFNAQIPPKMMAQQLEMTSKSLLGMGKTAHDGTPLRVVLISTDPGLTETFMSGVMRSEANGTLLAFRMAIDEGSGLIAGVNSSVIPGTGAGAAQTWQDLDERISAKPGELSVYIGEVRADGTLEEVFGHHAERRLAIGSTFKLYILGALAEMVRSGEATWDQELAIEEKWKSLPSGTMQNELPGTRHPLSHYALKMISISDNTATDHLLHFVGRERVEAYMGRLNADPARSTPFLTTREMFAMKLGEDRTLPERYINADLETRRAMLADDGEVARASPSMIAAAAWKRPLWIDTLEWFASAKECAGVIAEVAALGEQPGQEAALGSMTANPGIGFDRSTWTRIAFKGGSEPGVIALTWDLTRADGRRFVVSYVWNDREKEVPQNEMIELAGQGISLIGRHGRE